MGGQVALTTEIELTEIALGRGAFKTANAVTYFGAIPYN
jgi:hypothetical protein